jgi:hypothetical protein
MKWLFNERFLYFFTPSREKKTNLRKFFFNGRTVVATRESNWTDIRDWYPVAKPQKPPRQRGAGGPKQYKIKLLHLRGR